jgi:sugar lactone lactonase YvrE
VDVVRAGLGPLVESPRWHAGALWFADWMAGEVWAGDAVVARVPSFPISLDWLPEPDGRLLCVSGREGLLLADGALYADLRDLFAPPWNELVVDAAGRAYVNYAGFDFPGGEFAPGGIAVVEGGGATARIVADGLAFPNGMAITDDGTTLIVAESYASRLTAFSVAPDGGLSERRVWAAVPDSAPDGICLDTSGAVWYADVPNRHCVRVREGGEILDTVELDRGAFACALGGSDRRTLYIAAASWEGTAGIDPSAKTGRILAAPAPEPGAGFP